MNRFLVQVNHKLIVVGITTAVAIVAVYSRNAGAATLKTPSASVQHDRRLSSTHSLPPPPFGLDTLKDAQFATCSFADPFGRIWVGTEDQGLFVFDISQPTQKAWRHFGASDGPCDDFITSITVDRFARVWVGTLRHGVSVFNGKTWRNYDVMEGLGNSHVFAVSTDPNGNDVWIATGAGLNRYVGSTGQWDLFTKANGLVSEQINAITFTHSGDILLGTQVDGITVGSRKSGFTSWAHTNGPTVPSPCSAGNGLPSSLINAALTTPGGTIFVGTNCGLAVSRDHARTWQYVRGKDWIDKVKGMVGKHDAIDSPHSAELLAEDYITALALDAHNNLVVGYRQNGFDIRDPQGDHILSHGADGQYVRTMVPVTDGHIFAGFSGAAPILAGKEIYAIYPSVAKKPVPRKLYDLPKPKALPTTVQLSHMLSTLNNVPTHGPNIDRIMPLCDDWVTAGNWIDHYGDCKSILCNMGGGGCDQGASYRGALVEYRPWLGVNGADDDFLRYWVTWGRTENPNSLQDFVFGGRKQAEWDDHGETKPMWLDGPDVFCVLKMPKGHYVLSLYDFNKDGHTPPNNERDYVVEIKSISITHDQFKLACTERNVAAEVENAFFTTTPSVNSRIENFWGGVWKRFYVEVHGDGYIAVRVKRNYSFNTILCGLFLDTLDTDSPAINEARVHHGPRDTFATDKLDRGTICRTIIRRCLALRESNSAWYAEYSRPYELSALRALLVGDNSGTILASAVEGKDRNEDLRHDIAQCLRDVQLFDHSEKIWIDQDRVMSAEWAQTTEQERAINWSKAPFVPFDDYRFYNDYLMAKKNQSW